MTNLELLQLLRSEVIPAIGCTEPIAVALCTARAKELLGAEPDSITVHLSKNVYKITDEEDNQLAAAAKTFYE